MRPYLVIVNPEMPDFELTSIRTDFQLGSLSEDEMAADPFTQIGRWLGDALNTVVEPSAMTLATVDENGWPRARTVLLKSVDGGGFGFFTNRTSQKGRDLAANPRAALVLGWYALQRQVTSWGAVEAMSDEESDRYWATRPPEAQLGGWASEQSVEIASRAVLEERLEHFQEEFGDGEIPRPPHWGGFRLIPNEVEFWQGRAHRLHDRLIYVRDGDGWRVIRRSP